MCWLFFAGGLITGGTLGVVVMALMFAARNAEIQDQSSVK